jgi:hypothetical protein
MPCDRIILQSVDLSKCGDKKLLWDAVMSLSSQGSQESGQFMHYSRWFTLKDGVLSGDANYVGKLADKIKQSYSKQVILKAAKLQGWKVKDLGGNKLQVVKARY